MANRVAASLAPRDTEACLEILDALAPRIGLAEVRLDLMQSFELPRLIGASPCPLVLTYRPLREGGAFRGSEAERLAVLRQAVELNCAYVDVEWDTVGALAGWRGGRTRLLASRHWYDQMPTSLLPAYQELRAQADAVKLVGLAQQPADMLPVFELLSQADCPVVAIAMGAAGQLTRLLAPCFGHCLLTYAAATPADVTAAGQVSVAELTDVYHLDAAGPHTRVRVHLCANAESAAGVVARNQAAVPGKDLFVPLVVTPEQAAVLVPGLRAHLPRLVLTADAALGLFVASESARDAK